jgi:hypothetical protein
MATPNSKATLKEYCLRKLGKPVIEINVDDDQVDDRLDEALEYFSEFHFDGVERMFLKHQLTTDDVNRSKVAADIETTSTDGGTTAVHVPTTTTDGALSTSGTSVTLTSATSFPATGTITIATDGTNAAEDVAYTAVTGNVLTTAALANAHLDNSAVTLKITSTWKQSQAYIPIPNSVMSVTNVFPFSDNASMNMFDVRYQLRLNDLYDFSSTSIVHYEMTMNHLDFLDHILVGEKPIRYNVHNNRLYIDMDWANDMDVGEYFVIECYRKLDPTVWTDVYNDFFLKKYATQLIKRQWGANLIKFNGVQMLGGVTMNGELIYSQAQEEIQRLEDEMRLTYEMPIDFAVG